MKRTTSDQISEEREGDRRNRTEASFLPCVAVTTGISPTRKETQRESACRAHGLVTHMEIHMLLTNTLCVKVTGGKKSVSSSRSVF